MKFASTGKWAKTSLKIAGYILCGISFWLLYQILVAQMENVQYLKVDATSLLVLSLALLAVLVGHVNIVIGWVLQLRSKYKYISFRKSYIAIGISQIAKYLPGNVGHFIGRVILVSQDQSKTDASLAMLLETILLSLTAVLFSMFGVLFFYFQLSINLYLVALGMVCLVLSVYGLIELLKHRYSLDWISYRAQLFILGLNALSFLMHGVVIFLIAGLLEGAPVLSIAEYSFGFAAAFLVGYILPGAPGGIGIREYAFVLIFGTALGELVALEIILLHRILSIAGDIIFFVSGYAWKQVSK